MAIDANLAEKLVIENFEALSPNTIGFIKNFTLDFSDKAMDSRFLTQGIMIPVTTSVGAVNTDPTSFGTNVREVTGAPVAMHLYSVDWSENYNDAVPGENSLQEAIETLAEKLGQVTLDCFSTANGFDTMTADVAGAVTDDAKNELYQSIYAGLTKAGAKYLIGNSALYSKALPVNRNSFDVSKEGARGFAGVYESSILGSNLGVVCNKKALGIVNLIPEFKIDGLESQIITIDSLGGLKVALNKWSDLSSRAVKWSLDVAYGVGVFDKDSAKIITQG